MTDWLARALDKKYPGFLSLKRFHAYYKALAAGEGSFIAAVKRIEFPPDTVADVKDLIRKDAATWASEIELSRVRQANLNDAQKVFATRARQGSAAANLVRIDLGLPPIPA